jgi:succinate-acetate transporter protein
MATTRKTYQEEAIQERTRIFLQPIAEVSMLGFFAFSVAAFLAGGQFAGWRGLAGGTLLAPLLTAFFGLAQFAAAMWAFRARDGASTAFHGIWGAFWLSFGTMGLFGFGAPALMSGPLGYCFLALAFVSAGCAAAALATNLASFSVKLSAALAALAQAVAVATGSGAVGVLGGYFFVLSSVLAWYAGTALLIEESFSRAVLPVREFRYGRGTEEISAGVGEPGVRHGEWGLHKRAA